MKEKLSELEIDMNFPILKKVIKTMEDLAFVQTPHLKVTDEQAKYLETIINKIFIHYGLPCFLSGFEIIYRKETTGWFKKKTSTVTYITNPKIVGYSDKNKTYGTSEGWDAVYHLDWLLKKNRFQGLFENMEIFEQIIEKLGFKIVVEDKIKIINDTPAD